MLSFSFQLEGGGNTKISITGAACAIAVVVVIMAPAGTTHIDGTVHLASTSAISANSTIPGIQSQMNAFVFGLGAGLGNLATFAFQNSTAANPSVMLQDMQVYVYAPGNSTATIYFNGRIDSTHTFAWSTPNGIQAVAPSNTNIMTIVIDSSILGVTRTITYNISVLTTQNFITYEKTKLSPPSQIAQDLVGGLIILAIGSAIFFFRAHLPTAKNSIRRKNIKVGLVRLA